MKKFMLAVLAFVWINPAVSQVSAPIYRAVVIMSDAYLNSKVTDPSNYDYYNLNLLSIVDGVNAIYENSQVDTRMQVAAFIKDKTGFVGGSVSFNVYKATLNSNDQSNFATFYRPLMDEYAADFVILLAEKTSGTGDGAAPGGGFNPNADWGAIWTRVDSWYVFAHEAGHNYGLDHCEPTSQPGRGYRRTFDASGNFVTSGAVSGFHSLMEYSGGGCSSSISGDKSISTTFTNLMTTGAGGVQYYHDSTGTWYTIGTSTHNARSVHNNNDAAIIAYQSTPANAVITSDFNVDRLEYANLIATNSIKIESGFRVEADGELRISVGSHVLAKRGVKPENHFVEKETERSDFEFARDFRIGVAKASRTFSVQFNLEEPGYVAIGLFDARGNKKFIKDIGFIENEQFYDVIEYDGNLKGPHFLRVSIDRERIYKKVLF